MIVNCNKSCRESDGVTDASLNVSSNEAICNKCGDVIENISKFSKLSMKSNGDIIRSKNTKAFMFPCLTCDINVEVIVEDGVLLGKSCDSGSCDIKVTEHMLQAMASVASSSTREPHEE